MHGILVILPAHPLTRYAGLVTFSPFVRLHSIDCILLYFRPCVSSATGWDSYTTHNDLRSPHPLGFLRMCVQPESLSFRIDGEIAGIKPNTIFHIPIYVSASALNLQRDYIIPSITKFDMTGRRKVISIIQNCPNQ